MEATNNNGLHQHFGVQETYNRPDTLSLVTKGFLFTGTAVAIGLAVPSAIVSSPAIALVGTGITLLLGAIGIAAFAKVITPYEQTLFDKYIDEKHATFSHLPKEWQKHINQEIDVSRSVFKWNTQKLRKQGLDGPSLAMAIDAEMKVSKLYLDKKVNHVLEQAPQP